ncbi:MAG: MmgE/PrpD family protein [Xanthobacteraceae bacterium]
MATKHAGSRGPGLVEELADWTLAIRADDLPQATVDQAKLLLLDTIGCGYAALEEEATRAILETLSDIGGAPQCTLIGAKDKTSAPNAVLINGSLCRILDLNDYVNTRSGQIGGHPSDNIPAAFAAAELAGASGRETIASIVLGYEIYGRLKEAMDRDSDWDGIMVSGLAVPAMAGRLLGLTPLALANALALSGSRAPTPLVVRHGAISAAKSVANALVAQSGMQATLMARHGITGPLDLFENQHGLGGLFPGLGREVSLTAPLPADCYLTGCHVKAYPCLATGQSVVHAGLDIHRQVGGDVGRLAQITVAIADTPSLQRQKDDPGRIDPTSREAADHSFNFLAAVSLVDGEFGLAQFENERWHDPKVRGVMGRLDIVCDKTLNARSPGGFPCAIRARGTDGEDYVAEVLDPPGFSRHGLDADAVIRKFNAVTASHVGEGARARIVDAAMALDRSRTVGDLIAALQAANAAL